MSDSQTLPPTSTLRIGMAADHGGFELKEYLAATLREAHYEVFDFGDGQTKPDDDYPDFVVPLAHAVAFGEVHRGIAICGSRVGACIAANKVPGVRACLIHECFSARQGVEDDDMNVICMGGGSWQRARFGTGPNISAGAIHRPRASPAPSRESRKSGK